MRWHTTRHLVRISSIEGVLLGRCGSGHAVQLEGVTEVAVREGVASFISNGAAAFRAALLPSVQVKLWSSLWSSSDYVGSTGGASIGVVRRYIEHQRPPTGRGTALNTSLKKRALSLLLVWYR